MKKLVGLMVVIFCIGVTLFAQNATYAELLKKAKEYETKKEYAYALGFYYDAMNAENGNATEAFDCWNKLSQAIKNGNPGLGNYDDFSMFDGWLSLLRNSEKYWTEYSPYVFVFEELKKGDLNYQTKTAEYKLDFSTKFSQKYTAIMKETIIEGCRKSYKKDWPIDEHWPTNSVFTPKDGTPEQILSKYGVAVLKYPKVEGEGVVLHSEDLPEWGKVFIRYENDKDYYSPSVFANYYGTEHLGIITGPTERKENLYDVKFELCDKDGKLIAKSERTLMANISGDGTCSYTFKGIPADKMSLIDSSQYMIKITDVFLQYGTYNPKNEDKTGRGFIKNLSEISIPVSKIEYEVKGDFTDAQRKHNEQQMEMIKAKFKEAAIQNKNFLYYSKDVFLDKFGYNEFNKELCDKCFEELVSNGIIQINDDGIVVPIE